MPPTTSQDESVKTIASAQSQTVESLFMILFFFTNHAKALPKHKTVVI